MFANAQSTTLFRSALFFRRKYMSHSTPGLSKQGINDISTPTRPFRRNTVRRRHNALGFSIQLLKFVQNPAEDLESEVCAYLASINSCTDGCVSTIWVIFSRFRRLRREARRFSPSNPGNQHQHRNIQLERHARTELALTATCTGCTGRHRTPESLNFDEVGMRSVAVSASPLFVSRAHEPGCNSGRRRRSSVARTTQSTRS